MRILWLSQHRPLPVQEQWLRRRFGDVTLHQDVNPFNSAEQIKQRFEAGKYDDLVVVAPLSVIAKLVELGIKPLWAQMQQIPSQQGADLAFRGRYFRFETFRRIKALQLEFEEV